jgi:SAM-dependent methyltransferase
MTNTGVEDLSNYFEEIPCPLCQTITFTVKTTVKDRLLMKVDSTDYKPRERDYQIVACSSCGFLYLNPRPEPETLPSFYRSDTYDPHRIAGGSFWGRLFRGIRHFTVRWKAAKVSGNFSGNNLLDVGCGTGEFMACLKGRGWNCWGIETDPGATEVARSYGCEVFMGDPLDAKLPDDHFDLITLWHSLEHLPRLKPAAEKIVSYLKGDGRLTIAVPNPDSFDAEVYKSRWVAWDAPRHLYHFREKDLVTLFEPLGVKLVRRHAMPLDPFYHALLSELAWSKGISTYFKAMRGLLIGTIGFISGLQPRRASSTLYVFERA